MIQVLVLNIEIKNKINLAIIHNWSYYNFSYESKKDYVMHFKIEKMLGSNLFINYQYVTFEYWNKKQN